MGLSRVSLAGCLLVVFVAFVIPSKANDRIVGGQEVDITDYPYQVALYRNDYFVCGGSIISEHLVVTAAHCIHTNKTYAIRVGSSSYKNGGKLYQIDPNNIIVHKKFDSITIDYDIALLRLPQSLLSENSVARAIKLPVTGQKTDAGVLAKVSGWGYSEKLPRSLNEFNVNGNDDKLRAVEVPIVEQAECQKRNAPSPITDRMICAGYLGVGGKDSCFRDSGGPMVVDGVLIGVVSWGKGCADKNYPGVYANVANLRDWIKEHGKI